MSLDVNETVYGTHKYGMGVYRFDIETYEPLEYWLDYQISTPEEVKRYEQYLDENGWTK